MVARLASFDLFTDTLPEVPRIFPVKTTVPGGLSGRQDRQKNFLGKGEMEVSKEGITLRLRKTMQVGKGQYILQVPWENLRELKDRVQDKGHFVVNFGVVAQVEGSKILGGDDSDEVALKVKVLAEGREFMERLFAAIPEEAYCERCPECSGAVMNGVCRSCGEDVREAYRKKGLMTMAVGVGLFVLGGGISLVTYQSASSKGGTYFVFYGLMFVGVAAVVKGLAMTVTGRRVD
jgi:hypothetical protein